jgi:hypothetical protein
LSPIFGAQLIFNFLAGFFGLTAFKTAKLTLGDVFDHQTCGKIFLRFGAIALSWLMIAQVVGGLIGQIGMGRVYAESLSLNNFKRVSNARSFYSS